MKLDTKEKYDAWVLRKKRTKQQRHGLRAVYADIVHHHVQGMQIGFNSKPNHHERFANIFDCFPKLKFNLAEHKQLPPNDRNHRTADELV